MNGSSTVTVTDSTHGVLAGDYVTFSGAASLGGTVTAAVLNLEYEVQTVPSSNTYTITVAATANGSDTGNGGGSVVAAYQINIGIDTVVPGTGWGAGTYGRLTWGSAATVVVGGGSIRIWKQDNFGEDLVFNIRDGAIYYWDYTGGLSSRGVTLSSLGSSAPTVARQVLVSDRDRHVIAFGCNAQGSSTQDKLLIRFSDQENATDWAATAENTAGDLVIGSGTEIVQVVETRREMVILTDTSVYSMQFIGPPFTFGINLISLLAHRSHTDLRKSALTRPVWGPMPPLRWGTRCFGWAVISSTCTTVKLRRCLARSEIRCSTTLISCRPRRPLLP